MSMIISCTEEISEEIQNSESVPQSSSDADLFEDKAIRVIVGDEDDDLDAYSYVIHKEGTVSTECELDSPTLGFDVDDYDKTDPNYVIDCIVDAEELDIYFEGAKFTLEVDDNLCEYVSYEPFKFFTYQPGTTQRKVYDISCDDTCSDSLPAICNKSFRTIDSSVLNAGDFCWDPGTETITADATEAACEASDDTYVWVESQGSTDINFSNYGDVSALFSDEIQSSNDLCQFDYSTRYGDSNAPNCDPGSVETFSYALAVTQGRGACDTLPNIRSTEALCSISGTWLLDDDISESAFCYNNIVPEITADTSKSLCLTNGFDWYDPTEFTYDDIWGVAGIDGVKDGVDDEFRIGAGSCTTLPSSWGQRDNDGDGVGDSGNLIGAFYDNDFDGVITPDDYRLSVDFNIVHCKANGGTWTGPTCIDRDSNGDASVADYENFAYTVHQSKATCIANTDHVWSDGNCSVDEFVVTNATACVQDGEWEEADVCEATQQVKVELTTTSESACGGELKNCLGGPSTDILSDIDNTRQIFVNEDLDSFTKAFTIEAPEEKDFDSNMYVANYSRICSDTTNTKDDADFDALLTSIAGEEIEELAPITTYSPINVDSNSDGVIDYKIYANTPFNGRAVASTPRANVRPYYSLRCLDQSLDTKAQIRLFIRESDKSLTSTYTYKALISDINQGANARIDVVGNQEDGSPWNDANDWDNLLYDYDFDNTVDDNTVATDGGTNDYVYEDNSCQNLNVGYCMDYSGPARTADTNQSDCEVGGNTWIPSLIEYCYNETTDAKDTTYTDRDSCENAVEDDNADGIDDDMAWYVRAAGFPEDNL